MECGRTLYRNRIPLLCIAGLGLLGAAVATVFERPMYRAEASIQIQALNENFLSLRDIYPTAAPSVDNAVYIQTQAEILRQDALIENVVRKLRLDQRPDFRSSSGLWGALAGRGDRTALEQVKKSVQIVPSRGSSIIQIVAEARDPNLAADLANTLAQTFIDQSIDARQKSARETLFSLSLERDRLRKRLQQSEAALQGYAKADREGTGYSTLKRDLDANRQFYQIISQRADEARVASAVDQSNARLVSPAQPPARPFRPNLLLNLLIGAIGGLTVAVGYVMLREQTRQPWRTPGDVSTSLGLRGLGAIPQATTRSPFQLSRQDSDTQAQPIERATLDQSSHLSEPFRAAIASILANGDNGNHPRVLVFAGPRPGEGNTTVTSNLAIVFAEIGSRVLLIDADFRRPGLHKIFDQPNTRGLSDLLREKNAVEELPLDTLVKRTTVPRLYLLPGGSQSENIFALLWSGRLARLLARLRQGFDYVLIDAPPCLEFTDARILARYAEAVILVLRPDYGGKNAGQAAVQRLQVDGTPIMGVILNGWDQA